MSATKDSAPRRLSRKLDTLERRIDYLEKKPNQNSWDKAEIAALDLVLEVVEKHEETALNILRGVE